METNKLKKICKKTTGIILSSVMAVSLMFSMPITNGITAVVASDDSLYEQLEISKTSLNGNTIYGYSDSSGVGVDSYGFYSAAISGNGGIPTDGNLTVSGVPYTFAYGTTGTNAYNGNDSIKLTAYNNTQTVKLRSYGAYESVYVLATCGGPGTGHYARFKVTLTYTDDSTEQREYRLYDWFDSTNVSGVDKYFGFMRRSSRNGGNEGSTSAGPIMHSAKISANPGKLIKSITFNYVGKDAYGGTDSGTNCAIYAVTGKISANAPSKVKNVKADIVDDNGNTTWDAGGSYFTGKNLVLSWDKGDQEKTNKYAIDIATDKNFQNLVVNNELVDYDTTSATRQSYTLSNLSSGTKYYCRVRAVNTGAKAAEETDVEVLNTNNGKLTEQSVLTWDKIGTATEYNLEVSTKSDFSSIDATVASNKITSSSYTEENNKLSMTYETLHNLNSNIITKTKYYFRISASGSDSNVVSDATVTNTKLIKNTSTVTWNAVDNAYKYALSISTKNGETSTPIATCQNVSVGKVTSYDLTDFNGLTSSETFKKGDTLEWDEVTDAKKYRVEYCESKDGNYTELGSDYTTTSTTLNAGDENKAYYVKVTALDENNKVLKDSEGNEIAAQQVSTSYVVKVTAYKSTNAYRKDDYSDTTVNAVRKNVKVETFKRDETLTWDAVDGASKYKVEYCTSKDGDYTELGSNYITTSTTLNVDNESEAYYVKVTALDSEGNEIAAQQLYKTKTDTAKWASVQNAVSYTLSFYEASDTTKTIVKNIESNDTSYDLSNASDLEDGTYNVIVTANYTKDLSISNTTDGTYTSDSKATWSKVDNATGYHLYIYSDKEYATCVGERAISDIDTNAATYEYTLSGAHAYNEDASHVVSLSVGTQYYVKVYATFSSTDTANYSSSSSNNAVNTQNESDDFVKTQPKSFEYTLRYDAKDESSLFLTEGNDFTPSTIIKDANTKAEANNWVLESLGKYNGDFEGNATDDEIGYKIAQWYYNIAHYMATSATKKVDKETNVEIYKLRKTGSTDYTLGVICGMTDQTVTFRTFDAPSNGNFYNPSTYYETSGSYYVFTKYDPYDTSIKQDEKVLQDITALNNKTVNGVTVVTGGYVKHVHNWEYKVSGSKIYAYCTEPENNEECEYQGEVSDTKTDLSKAFVLTASVTGNYNSGTNTEPTIQIGTTEELKIWNQKVDLKDWLSKYGDSQITRKYYYSTGEGMIRKLPLSNPTTDEKYTLVPDDKKDATTGSPNVAGDYVIDLSFGNSGVVVPVAYSIYANVVNVPDECKPTLTTESLTYDGNDKSLVVAGKTSQEYNEGKTGDDVNTNFVIKYQITSDNNPELLKNSKWSDTCKVTDAGKYYVWWKAIPTDDEEKTATQPVCLGSVTVAPKEVTLNYVSLEATYDGNGHKPTVTADGIIAADKNKENFKVTLTGMFETSSTTEVVLPGNYTAKVTMSSNYTATNDTSKTYVVKAKADDFTVSQDVTSVTYGSSTKPEVKVFLGKNEYTDYFKQSTVYSNGTATEAKGIGTVNLTVKDEYTNFVTDQLKATFLVKSNTTEEADTTITDTDALAETGIENTSTEVKVSKDLPEGTTVSDAKDLLSSVLTEEDKDSINGKAAYDDDTKTGTKVSVSVSVSSNAKTYDPSNTNGNSISTASYNSINNALSEVTGANKDVISYFDFSIYKTVNTVTYDEGDSIEEESTSTNEEVTETATPVAITVAIPEELTTNVPANFTRTYIVVRSHEVNGQYVSTVLDSVVDGNTISFASNQFSDFAIVAKDVLSSNVKSTTAINGKNGAITGLVTGYYRYKLANGDYTYTNAKVSSLTGLANGTYTLAYSSDNSNYGNEFKVEVANKVVEETTNKPTTTTPTTTTTAKPAATPVQTVVATATQTLAVGNSAVSTDGATVTLLTTNTVSYKNKATNASTLSVPSTQVVNGTTYTVTALKGDAFNGYKIKKVTLANTITKINAKAFSGDHKLTYIKINSKTLSISSTAFKGLKSKEKKKIKVVVSKNMSKKNFNALRTKLVKLGLKKSNITRK